MIWLLGTQRDKTAFIKKKKSELLRTDLMALCKELATRFPVQGKEKSFSLRMSATLVYGVCINLRVQCEELRRATQNLLSVKAVSVQPAIDLPDMPTSTHITRGHENDLPGIGDFHISQQDLQLSPSLVRATVRDITLNEGTTMRDLDYQGLELPILTDKELLEQPWNLEEQLQPEENEAVQAQEVQMGEENGKRRREEEEDGAASSRRKKARSDEAMEQQGETFHVAVEPPDMPAAPGRHEDIPEVVVTPAVTELPKRRTSPQQLDLDEAVADPALLLPDPVVQDVAEVQQHAPQEIAQAGEPDVEFLQPLVPAEPPKGGRGKKKTNVGAQVDEVVQLRGQDIKWNMSPEGWTRNLRCGIPGFQDLVQLPDETKVNKDWGEELGGLIKEVLRRRVRAPWWGGAVAEGGLQEQVAEVEVARDNGVHPQDGVGQEELDQMEVTRRSALETSKDLSVPMAAQSRDGSLSRNTLQLDAVQAGDATGQDHVGGELMGGHDLLQTGDQPDLNLTPVQHQVGGRALDVSPVQPDAVMPDNQNLAGEEVLLQELSQDIVAQQGGEEVHISEFSLLASIQDLEENGTAPVTFTRLCPRASTRCFKAATTFQGLLKLEKASKVVSEQEENFAEITITLVV